LFSYSYFGTVFQTFFYRADDSSASLTLYPIEPIGDDYGSGYCNGEVPRRQKLHRDMHL